MVYSSTSSHLSSLESLLLKSLSLFSPAKHINIITLDWPRTEDYIETVVIDVIFEKTSDLTIHSCRNLRKIWLASLPNPKALFEHQKPRTEIISV